MYQMILPTHGMAASMLLFGALPQLALAGWSLDTLTEQSCFPDGVCTAKDVVFDGLKDISVSSNTCPNGQVTFRASVEVDTTASKRYDFAFYAEKKQKKCDITVFPRNQPNAKDEMVDDGDTCGDAAQGITKFKGVPITAACVGNALGQLTLPVCLSWEQQKGFNCFGATSAAPGTRSKCVCKTVVVPEISVTGQVVDDPHMVGFQGQRIDWKGEDGGWYVLLNDDDVQLSVRLTAPLVEEFPDRQLMTAVAMKYGDGHSVIIETKEPYSTETEGCPDDWYTPCLAENALRIIVDGKEHLAVPTERSSLPGDATITASNLPAECQPYGGDLIWANTFAQMCAQRRVSESSFIDWVSSWSESTAAPGWCDKFLAEAGVEGALMYSSKHAVFSIDTPALAVRVHHGTNHQGSEALDDGRVLPELEFWQMNVYVEHLDVNADTVTGILGETARPVLDEAGLPIMYGSAALRGEVEDYRISGPLATDFKHFDT